MRSITVFILALFVGQATAQVKGVPVGPSGTWTVGYADTLLFNEGLHYTGSGYTGPAPLFVQVWFPTAATAAAPLTHGQIRQRQLDGPLRAVYQELVRRMDSSFVEYDLRYPLGGDVPIDYTPFTERQVLDTLLTWPTRCHRAPLPERTDAPVILYHHGSQGSGDENEEMAEYFASRGYTFVSANFHWPLERAMYGTPLEWRPDRGSIQRMIDFARGLTTSDSVFYVGHSWGAQEGWCTLHVPGLAQAFVSLETTIEWKTDTVEIEDKWPHVFEAVRTHRYALPILLVANTEGAPPYPFFVNAGDDIRYLDPRDPFSHESYTSAAFLRLAMPDGASLPDRAELEAQHATYRQLLRAMALFFDEVRAGPGKEWRSFTNTFHVHPRADR
ncbi:MAG: alpha/beta fold hydrolase [Flavobacteriales bacterium]|nr:alpha/beta fold hydrolase [Flavobacteriales bacterium]MCB9166544.1 alpha/beta fold hydrolase [Flavobacteriales bacterium]